MDYAEVLTKLEHLGRFGMVLTLDRIKALLDLLGHPEERLRVVHVAGTNGKGSTVAMLDAILRAGGWHTGRWTSPHLVDFRERICLDGRPVTPDELCWAFARVWPAVERIKDGPAGHPTQFEAGTAMAFLLLAEAGVDLALIEVGLGGRYDSTNVFTPLLSVITHLALDHMDRLGPDLRSIAMEKAGIIKEGRPVVIAPQEPDAMRAVFEEAVKHSAPMTVVGRDLLYETAGLSMDGTMVVLRGATDYGLCRVNLLGAHQAVNAAVAAAASEVLAGLGYETGPDAVKRGLDMAIWPGRLEIISRKPLTVLDGAHNPDGMKALARAIREVFRRNKADFLLGILENRPVEEMAGLLVPLARRVVVTNVVGGTAPSAGVDRLASVFAGTGAIIQVAPDPRDALRTALDGLPEDGLLCVCGSLYLVGMIRGMMVET